MDTSTLSDLPDAIAGRSAVSLLGGFGMWIGGRRAALPLHSRRVLAYLALDKTAEPDCDRRILAERLWPDSTTERSRASLRTALWRIRQADPDLVCCTADRIMLAHKVEVDVHQYKNWAGHLLATPTDCPRERAQLMVCNLDLLPGWDETWLLLAREQLRQLRLHALEVSGRRLAADGRYPEAIDVMLIVVAEEPLRESAQSVLIEAHLCEGNVVEARRQFDAFASLLFDELGVLPSPELYGRVGARPPRPVEASTAPPTGFRRMSGIQRRIG